MNYRDIFTNAFPVALKDDVISVLDILPLSINAVRLTDVLIYPSRHTVNFNGDLLNIPYRIYFDEPGPYMIGQLTHTQKIIFRCIYLRHHNGYLRQRRLEELTGLDEDWIVPHTLPLLGDYVLEIIETLDNVITDENIQYYGNFIRDNPKCWRQTVSRMISYWDCYYRRYYFQNDTSKKFPEFKYYPGKQIADRLEWIVYGP